MVSFICKHNTCLIIHWEVLFNMKKVELVEAVATATGLTKADATRAIDATFATITEALVKGDKVPLVGFGTFSSF